MGITSLMNIAKNSMLAQQAAIQVTSNNIANVNTEGYCRQVADLREGSLVPAEFGLLGTGVRVAGLVTYYDKFLETSIANKNTDLQQQNAEAAYFSRIETVISEDNSNLAATITDFFNAWQALSADPTSYAARNDLVTKGENLSRIFNNLYNDLSNLQMEIDKSVEGEVGEVNRLSTGVADLNGKIIAMNATNGEDADYINERAQLLKELSGKIRITAFEDQAGGLTVQTADGKTLVDRSTQWNLSTQPDPDTGFRRIAWEDGSGNPRDITDEVGGGKIKALVDMRDGHLQNGFIKDLDGLAKTIVTEVNTMHALGYNQKGKTDVTFFRNMGDNFAGDMGLNAEVKTDVRNIAAASASTDTTGNDVALKIASLVTQRLTINGQATTLTSYVSNIMGKIGEFTKNAEQLSEQQQSAMTMMERQREGVSGVSIDEEMSNLIKYQYAYQAAARLITVADEMFTDLLGVIE